jgi:hypothetical protein
MILNSLNIQVSIIKAYYALAKKAVKYYTGLALGKDNICLFKEMRVLRSYVDILKNFEIVDSTITCSCCVEGDYTVLLNELSESTEARIQFNCDNVGGMFFNNISYPFTYFYDSDNKIIVIEFSTLIDPDTDNPATLTLDEVVFEDDCSFEPNTVSPIEVAVIEPVDGIPIIVNNIYGNWDGNITIYELDGITILHTLTIPSSILNNPDLVVIYWNNNGPDDWILLYDGTQYTMLTPFDGTNYSTYIIEFNQYEGGTDSYINFEDFIPQPFIPTGTRASTIIDIPNTFVGSVAATSEINPSLSYNFVTTPEQATTIVELQTNIFNNPGTKASTQFTVRDIFFKCTNNGNYIYTPTSNVNWNINLSAAGLNFANIEDCITYINSNLSFGYPLELISTSVITYPSIVDASSVNYFFNFSNFTAGDNVYINITSTYYNTSDTVGSYIVLPGDTNTDIVNALIADVIAQGIFQGTITADINNILYFTAPAGTGSAWNTLYYSQAYNATAGQNSTTVFNYGNNLTENEYTLSITAPTEGSIYNTHTSYTFFGSGDYNYTSLFNGTDPSTAQPVEVTDTLNGQLYYTATNAFTSIDDFITAFNGAGATQAANVGINGSYTEIEFTAPPSNTNNAIYNNEDLNININGNLYDVGTYFGGVDTTECTYTLELYDPLNVLVLPVIENLTPTNYASLAQIATDIQNNPLNTYTFGASVNVNNKIATTYPYPFVVPQSLITSTYNDYYFVLNITYTSSAYDPYTSTNSIIGGGIDSYSKGFEISDSFNGTLLLRADDTFNYPNGSEIKDGLIPDFNTNNTGALPLLYSAEYISAGTPTNEIPASVNNDFLTELASSGVTNGNEINAYIDNTYIGKYQLPVSGVLPAYSAMIISLNTNIVSNNIVPGLTSFSAGSGIIQISPPGQAANYNGKLLKINKKTYTAATTTLNFGNATSFTYFRLFTDGLGTIATFQSGPGTYPGAGVAATIANSINSSGTGITATRISNVVTVISPPYTGGSYNFSPIKIDIFNDPPYNAGSVVINTYTYFANGNWFNFPIVIFGGGTQSSNILIKQAAFIGGIPSITTTKVKFNSPVQPLTASEYGTGNWVYNSEDLFYDYNLTEYFIQNLYSGGIDSTAGQFTVQVLDSGLNPLPPPFPLYLYNDITPQNYLNRETLVNTFNTTNPFPLNFQINVFEGSNSGQFLSPPTSFDDFNTCKFRYSYDYLSPQYTDYVDITATFGDGIDPVLTPYEGEFVGGDIGPFITDNPCSPTIVKQTCLTNKDVEKIINNINKLTK